MMGWFTPKPPPSRVGMLAVYDPGEMRRREVFPGAFQYKSSGQLEAAIVEQDGVSVIKLVGVGWVQLYRIVEFVRPGL